MSTMAMATTTALPRPHLSRQEQRHQERREYLIESIESIADELYADCDQPAQRCWRCPACASVATVIAREEDGS